MTESDPAAIRTTLSLAAESVRAVAQRGYAPLLLTSLVFVLFAASARHWWLESYRRTEHAHRQFQAIVETRTGFPDREYEPLVATALELGYLDTHFECGNAGVDDDPEQVCASINHVFNQAPLDDWGTGAAGAPAPTLLDWDRDGAPHETEEMPAHRLPGAHGREVLLPAWMPDPSPTTLEAVAAWETFRSSPPVSDRPASDPSASHPFQVRGRPAPDAAHFVQLYVVTAEGAVAVASSMGGGDAYHALGPWVDLRGREYMAELRRPDSESEYRSAPYVDRGGFGVVRTRCLRLRASGASFVGVLCADYTLPFTGHSRSSVLVAHALMRVAASGAVSFDGGDDWLSVEDRARIQRMFEGDEGLLADELDTVLRTRADASVEPDELARELLAQRVDEPGAAVDVGADAPLPSGTRSPTLRSILQSRRTQDFIRVRTFSPEDRGSFLALVPLRRNGSELEFVVLRPRQQDDRRSLYLTALLGFLAIACAGWAVFVSRRDRFEENEAAVLQNLQVGVVRSDEEDGMTIVAANDRAEELIGYPLPPLTGGTERRGFTHFFELDAFQAPTDPTQPPDAYPTTTIDEIQRQRERGETSRYYVRKRAPEIGKPKVAWLSVWGSPELSQPEGTKTRVRPTFAILNVPSPASLSRLDRQWKQRKK